MSKVFSREFHRLNEVAKGESVGSEPESFGYCKWEVHVFPKGQNDARYEGWCGVCLKHSGPPARVECSITVGNTNKRKIFLFNQDNHGWSQFLPINNLPDDIRIEVSITVLPISLDYLQRIAYDTDNFTDFTIVSNSFNFKVHKVILSMQSAMLKAMLLSEMEESRTNVLEIIDFDDKVVEWFVNLMYGNETNFETLSVEEEMELLKISDKYATPYVQCVVEQELEKRLSVDNCIEVLLAADRISKYALREKTLQFLKVNVNAVIAKHGSSLLETLGPPLAMEVFTMIATK